MSESHFYQHLTYNILLVDEYMLHMENFCTANGMPGPGVSRLEISQRQDDIGGFSVSINVNLGLLGTAG